ncbi:MAG TPA: methyltransferase domain-containing protein [Acidimicrobiales bacterium]|nr:methyltransferase domain-containing protein [Acidimicrobiales bacterium]
MTEHWFEPLAEHMGEAYLRYSFTKGTEQEVAFLVDVLGLAPGMRVLDVGCGPGRHAHALAVLGVEVVGLDISQRFVDLATEHAPAGATFVRGDARTLSYDGEFDVALSLCQGGFGLVGDEDGDVLKGMARAVKPGGRVGFSAFSAYFLLQHLESHERFDAERGVSTEQTEVRNEAGEAIPAQLHTSVFTPRELRLLCAAAGLVTDHIWSVTPGDYARRPPDLVHPEWLVLATRA